MTALGRIDPPKSLDASLADPDAPPSRQVLRELHDDLVVQKRRAFLRGSPLLALAIGAWMAAAMDPRHFGGLVLFAITAIAGVSRVGYEWLTLRRADPLTVYLREQRAEEERRAHDVEFLLRSGQVKPVATMLLIACIVAVTVVEFTAGPLQRSIAAAGLVKPAVRAGEWWRLLTASYLHGGLVHLAANATGLLTLGRIVETYDRRLRVPLVYLVAAVGGNILSTLLIATPAVGASGGILGLAGYLLVVAGRDPNGTPAWMRRRMISILGATAILGVAAFMFIDNAGHLGGALSGALAGCFVTRFGARHQRQLDVLGLTASGILAVGAVVTVLRVLFAIK